MESVNLLSRTLYEWEALLKLNLMPVDDKDVDWMAHRLCNRFPWSRTSYDWIGRIRRKMLELRSGIMKSYLEIEERTLLQVNEVKKICKEKGWGFFPIGTHPSVGNAVGLHVHIGSIYEFGEAARIANSLARYVPCFAALAANSPVWGLEAGEYKSYRVLNYADYMSPVTIIRDPELGQSDGLRGDVHAAIGWHPTIEIRIGDSPSSAEFVVEYVTFVAAFVVGLLRKRISGLNQKV